jgi:hypothetical protein
MFKKSMYNVKNDLQELLTLSKASPYVFRTRLERVLYKLNHSNMYNNSLIKEKIEMIGLKLKCLSDQSNQTPDGTLNSFTILKKDLEDLLKII